ncbi:MAG: hypothetical protein K1X74_23215 [Pirellulales bacterium]|nr:hypothetical protein [Pirellulales bacterium]
MGFCFAILPFDERHADIDRILAAAADDCGLGYVRGDHSRRPGSVVSQIVEQIRNAAVVVADISDQNPNVFYELGIAHQLLGPERVVIITQPCKSPPYDVHEFRQLNYVHTETGRQQLRADLPQFIRAAIEARTDGEVWNIIRGRVPRTRMLVRDLRRWLDEAAERPLDGTVIRMVAGLGSLAISDHEPADPHLGLDYKKLLLEERNLLRSVLGRGARMKLVLNPPRGFPEGMLPQRLRDRYARLIGLLQGTSDIQDDPVAAQADLAAIDRCAIALTSVPLPHLVLLGEDVAYEGLKRGATHGFEMTHCERNISQIREMIVQFDQLFDSSRGEMLRSHPPDGRLVEQLRGLLASAQGAMP